ncbi:hypothetical protein [Mesorhizobium amorphae]|uniref:sunset domain-containing protein n=1 Tax=Mesorhizobium amorphae TaxID=71433 RepID=UPI001181DE68|nr:hypothetical protein [Mesorhizobium amorphae]
MRGGSLTVALLIAGGGGFGLLGERILNSTPSTVGLFKSNCVIKGNVSIGSGEHIYHVPGQVDYDRTIIRPEYGERWFCSEAEARQAGWRKAGR